MCEQGRRASHNEGQDDAGIKPKQLQNRVELARQTRPLVALSRSLDADRLSYQSAVIEAENAMGLNAA